MLFLTIPRDKSNVCIFINTEAIKYHSRLRDESNFILKCEFNAVFVQIVNNKIYGVEYGLFGRYGMKEELYTEKEIMKCKLTVLNYNGYSLTQFVLHFLNLRSSMPNSLYPSFTT